MERWIFYGFRDFDIIQKNEYIILLLQVSVNMHVNSFDVYFAGYPQSKSMYLDDMEGTMEILFKCNANINKRNDYHGIKGFDSI